MTESVRESYTLSSFGFVYNYSIVMKSYSLIIEGEKDPTHYK